MRRTFEELQEYIKSEDDEEIQIKESIRYGNNYTNNIWISKKKKKERKRNKTNVFMQINIGFSLLLANVIIAIWRSINEYNSK